MKKIADFYEYIVKDVMVIYITYFHGKSEDIEEIDKNKLSQSEQYTWAVSNRLIHLNNLIEEINYGFRVFEESKIPEE